MLPLVIAFARMISSRAFIFIVSLMTRHSIGTKIFDLDLAFDILKQNVCFGVITLKLLSPREFMFHKAYLFFQLYNVISTYL
jgi:multisubunit Na+/H+ antiporter MnhF subunit